MTAGPQIHWFRRDLRLADNPALTAAAAAGPVVPVFVLDPETEALGAAALWRLGRGLDALGSALAARGSRLVLRRGPAAAALQALVGETGARGLHYARLPAPDWSGRDQAVVDALSRPDVAVRDHPGQLLHDPGAIRTGDGGAFRVFTPFWRAIAGRRVADLLPPPRLDAPGAWPASDRLGDWCLGARMNRGAEVVGRFARVGEPAALERLDSFLDTGLAAYATDRDRPDRPGTSGLSENLTWGEIAPARVWHATRRRGGPGSEAFLREIAWREFAWHLLVASPDLARRNWRPGWNAFPWRADNADAERWRRGETGEPIVDAGMRQLFATGTMHNRIRMVVASYLTKHLLTDWRVGLAWFEDCLIDWDPAANALNWQWVAGSGPDAAPYFRIFNPATQAERFDPEGAYRRHFLEGPGADAFLAAAPRAWGLAAGIPRPEPLIDLKAGRARALETYNRYLKSS